MTITEQLERAALIWSEASGHAPSEMARVQELQAMGIFSNRQVAKICRVSSAFVNGLGPSLSGGGRFNPATLTAMVQISKIVDRGETIPVPLLSAVADDGTSINFVARLLGVGHGLLYYRYHNKGD